MADRIEDSLDNLSGMRNISPVNKEKDEKDRSIMHSLRQKFITALSKLQSSETREIALNEIRKTIDQNREPEHIRMYLSLMKSLKIQGTSSSTKEHEVLIFSIMAELLKDRLADPIDKPPSPVKTTFRIIEILHQYFIDSTNTVQQACARVLIDLARYVLAAQNSESDNKDPDTIINLLFSPLASILKSGVDKASQSTSAVCINEMVQYWKRNISNETYKAILDKIAPEMLSVILRLNCEYHEIFMAITVFIDLQGLSFFKNKIIQFVSKILGVINRINNKNAPEPTNNLNSYMSKVYVCCLLEKIGDYLRGEPELKSKLDELDVALALERASRNRVIQVQTAAQRALRVWKGEVVTISPTTGANPRKDRIMSLEDARNNIKKAKSRSNSREEKVNLEHELNYMKEDLNKLVKGGWGPRNRANHYVKKNSGVGGGYSAKMEHSPSPQHGNNKSHKEHIEQLRQFIKQNAQEHGKKDKFTFYQEKSSSQPSKAQRQVPRQGSGQEYRERKEQGKLKEKPKRKQRRNDEDSVDFELEEEGGDQGAYLPPDSQQSMHNPYANPNYGNKDSFIGEQQARQLLENQEKYQEHEMSNLEEQIKEVSMMKEAEEEQARSMMKINMSKPGKSTPPQSGFKNTENAITSNNKKHSQVRENYPNPNSTPNNNVSKQKSQTNSNKNIESYNNNNNERFSNPKEMKQTYNTNKPTFNHGPEVDEDHLSGVSLNMDGLLNQSDFDCLGSQKGQFFKERNKDITEIMDSLNFSDTGRRNFSKGNSRASNGKNQFTLGPQKQQIDESKFSKFNSYMQKGDSSQRQILDESYYEQSKEIQQAYKKSSEVRVRGQQNIEKYYEEAVQHERKLNQQTDQNQSQIYQEMIKNPPKACNPHRLDRTFSLNPIKSEDEQEEEYAQPEQVENITDIWEHVLELVEQGEVNEAYSKAFQMDDPIYLLRLMLLTQTPLGKLTPANTCKLWQKFLQIYQHRFIDNIFVQMFSESMRLSKGKGLKNSLSIEETNELMIELFELSGRTKGKLSFGAANLYNQIDESIHSRRE